MNKKYFKLFACCVSVKGARRSIICDLQRLSYKFIPTILFEILNKYISKNKTINEIKKIYGNKYDKEIDGYFDCLIENEFGFFCDNPENFPPLDLTWKIPNLIQNAIIDIDRKSNHDYALIFKQLDEVGCEALQIRMYDCFNLEYVKNMIKYSEGTNLSSIEILMKDGVGLKKIFIKRIMKDFPRLIRFFIHSSVKEEMDYLDDIRVIGFFKKKIESNECCGIVSPYYFSPTIETFTEAQNYNTCLNKKISIDLNGDIKNCPSLKISYGNIEDTSLINVINKKNFKTLWDINKDQIEICKDCEFRYICTDCRAFIKEPSNIYSKPSKCTYDPYTATWK